MGALVGVCKRYRVRDLVDGLEGVSDVYNCRCGFRQR